MSNQNDSEEEYVPPGKRLITPPDVVDIDPNMTVFWSIVWSNYLGTVPCWNAGLQSDSNRRNSSSHQSHSISWYFYWNKELGTSLQPNPQNAEHGYARQSRSVGVIRQQNPRDQALLPFSQSPVDILFVSNSQCSRPFFQQNQRNPRFISLTTPWRAVSSFIPPSHPLATSPATKLKTLPMSARSLRSVFSTSATTPSATLLASNRSLTSKNSS